ncbi:MAG: anhydro-N-acetylmuramic acid kinase [Gemmatimonadetes bacterium]|nr:anhydro-N-acetylmuramic acid kinase [Gemmatimonadota bacterium]
MRVVGLMSGTSVDGIDAALIEIAGEPGRVVWHLRAFLTVPWAGERRARIQDAMIHGDPAGLCRLHADLGEWFADAVREVCTVAGLPLAELDLIGSHGQTIWHEPPGASGVLARRGATLQLGDPATIAERTGVPVVSDFRTRDMAAAGQGAPLVPWADRHLYAAGHARALLNIGGMANVTHVPPAGSDEPLLAFDTGPGNALIDGAAERASGGRLRYDADGGRARTGRVDPAVLEALLRHPFFAQEPPKSTGREVFGRGYLDELVREHPALDPAAGETAGRDLVATLTALTARTIAQALARWVLPRGAGEVVVTGGGARNPWLVELIARGVRVPVRTGDEVGIDVDAKEAVAFAALAWAHVCGIPGNVPEATGARGPRVLGSYTPAGAPRAPFSRAAGGT